MTKMVGRNKQTSGSKLGWSFLQTASDCPWKWYLRNLAPWPGADVMVDPTTKCLSMSTGERSNLSIGLQSKRFAPALSIGTWFHTGVETFYRSGISNGVDTGVRSLDAAIAAINDSIDQGEASDKEREALAVTLRLMRNYHSHYQQDSDVEVLMLDNTPGIEYELWLDLGFKDYLFTSRLDMIYRKNGYIYAMEHKTTAASKLGKLISRFSIDGQVTGQYLQLVSHFPDDLIGGVTMNAAVKDRGAKSDLPSFVRRDYARTPAQMEKFRLDIVRKLNTIDGWVEQWLEMVAKGMSFEDAALAVFDGTPNGMQCVGTGFACDFLELCQNREVLGRLLLDNYQPREYRDNWSNPMRKPATDDGEDSPSDK